MFGDVNSVTLMGNITRDLELRHTPNGTPVCSFSIATNRRYQQNDEWKEEVQFHNIVIWGQRAESFVQRAKKGTRVYIEGRLQTRSWDDQEGKKQYKTEVVVLRLILIDRYEKFDSGMQQKDKGTPDEASSQGSETKDQSSENNKDSSEEKIDPDDLPF
jgi:single-strand DNA-binding protein